MKEENVKILQILGWDGVFNVGVMEWHHGFDGTQSTSLAVSETLKVMKYDCKTNFS